MQPVIAWLNSGSRAHLKRDVVLRLPHFVVVPEIVMNTDLAVIFPKSIARCFNRGKAFRILPLPFALPRIEIQVHSHTQFAADAGIAWLREPSTRCFISSPSTYLPH
jgi:DNA-binding transcriptional LysR family regulator